MEAYYGIIVNIVFSLTFIFTLLVCTKRLGGKLGRFETQQLEMGRASLAAKSFISCKEVLSFITFTDYISKSRV